MFSYIFIYLNIVDLPFIYVKVNLWFCLYFQVFKHKFSNHIIYLVKIISSLNFKTLKIFFINKLYEILLQILNFFIFIFIQIKSSSFCLNDDDNIINSTNISSTNKLTKSIIEGDKILRSGLSLSERKAAIKVVNSNLDKIKSLKNSSDDPIITEKLIKDYIKNLEINPLYNDFTPLNHIEDSTSFIFIYIIIGLYILLYLLYFIYILYRFFLKK